MENNKKEGNISQNEILLKYKIDENADNQIKIFGEYFVKNNKKKCKIIIDSKEYNLCSHLPKNKINKSILELKLKILHPLKSMRDMFSKCKSLIYFCDNNLDTSQVSNISNLFLECRQLSFLSDISKWKTSQITDMSSVFKGCKLLSNISDISKWDTSKVINMSYMFSGCSSLTSLPDISIWNLTNVTDISCMFEGCSSLSIFPDISKWNTSNINFMSDTFKGCSSLSTLPEISKWNISNVVFMNDIFRECFSLIRLPGKLMMKN